TSRHELFFATRTCPSGGIGRRRGLKIPRRKACRFDSGLGHHPYFPDQHRSPTPPSVVRSSSRALPQWFPYTKKDGSHLWRDNDCVGALVSARRGTAVAVFRSLSSYIYRLAPTCGLWCIDAINSEADI